MVKHELRVENLKARVDSLKARVKIQKWEFKSTSYDLKSTSYQFKSTSLKIIISMKNQVDGYQSFTRILKIRSDVISFASQRNFKQSFV